MGLVGQGEEFVGDAGGVTGEDRGEPVGGEGFGLVGAGLVEGVRSCPLGRPRGEVPVAGSFSARPPAEPRGQLSLHVALSLRAARHRERQRIDAS